MSDNRGHLLAMAYIDGTNAEFVIPDDFTSEDQWDCYTTAVDYLSRLDVDDYHALRAMHVREYMDRAGLPANAEIAVIPPVMELIRQHPDMVLAIQPELMSTPGYPVTLNLTVYREGAGTGYPVALWSREVTMPFLPRAGEEVALFADAERGYGYEPVRKVYYDHHGQPSVTFRSMVVDPNLPERGRITNTEDVGGTPPMVWESDVSGALEDALHAAGWEQTA